MSFYPRLKSLHSKCFNYLSAKNGVTRTSLGDPLEYLEDEVTIPGPEGYTEISDDEFLEAIDSSFEKSFEEENYIWESDISPRELEKLINESENFSAARNPGDADRYAFVIEGDLQHFHNPFNSTPPAKLLPPIETSPVLLTGTVYEKESLFECQTKFKFP